MVAALILTLLNAARIKSDVITSFKHIQAIDWNDGETVDTLQARDNGDQKETRKTYHSRSFSSTIDPENITSIEFDRPASLQRENLTSIEFNNPVTTQNENLHLRSKAVHEENTTAISTSDWNDLSSDTSDTQTSIVNSFPNKEHDKQQLFGSNHSEVARELPAIGLKRQSSPLINLRNSSASYKNTHTYESLSKPSESETKVEEPKVIFSSLDIDDFIPFSPNETEQIIQPILIAKESQVTAGIGKEGRPRSKIKAIEISGFITPRPSRRNDNAQFHDNTFQAGNQISVEGSARQTPHISRDIKVNITASVSNDLVSSTLQNGTLDSNTDDSSDIFASESIIVQDDTKKPILPDALQDHLVIPSAYMWNSYMVHLDPAEILANDSVVSMFDFINISNATESELENGDTLFLPYGIVDTSYFLPTMMNNGTLYENGSSVNSTEISQNQGGYLSKGYDDLFIEGSNPFMSFYIPVVDQVAEGSTLTGKWANAHTEKSSSPAAPRSFAEFALSYARALKHDDISKKPERQRQSLRVFSVDEHGRPHTVEKEEQLNEREQQKPSQSKGNAFWTSHRSRQKPGRNTDSINVTNRHHKHPDATHGKYETPSETAFHHIKTASIPFGFPKVPPFYSFKYDVQDLRGNYFGHEEVKDLLKTRGKYYVLLPDGRLQTVTYFANRTGYYPHVAYTDFGAHPDFRNFKHILIPKYPSSPNRPSSHSIVTPVPVIHHSTTHSPTLLPVSPLPDVIHKPNHSPFPQKYNNEELHIPNYLSRHWFRTLKPPSLIERPFPPVEHLHHGHSMPLLKPFHPSFRHSPRQRQNSVQIIKAKVENVNDHIRFTSTSSPLLTPPVSLPPTTELLSLPFPGTPLPTSTPASPFHLIPGRPPFPPSPNNNPHTAAPVPIPILPTTPSINVTPKSAPRPLPLPKAPVTTPYPTTKKITVVHHHHTTTLPPHSSFQATTRAPPHPILRPVPLRPATPSPHVPHLHLGSPLKAGTLRLLHSTSTPHPDAHPLHSQLPYYIPGLSNLMFLSRRLPIIPPEPFMSMGTHHFSPFLPMHFHTHLHPDEIPSDHQAIGYLNAEHMILMNPRIHIFQPVDRDQPRPHPVQTSLPSKVLGSHYLPDDAQYHHPSSVVSEVTHASRFQRDKHAAPVPKAYSNPSLPKIPQRDHKQPHSYTASNPNLSTINSYTSDPKSYHFYQNTYNNGQNPFHSGTIPDETLKNNVAASQVTSVLDELAEYDEAAKDYI